MLNFSVPHNEYGLVAVLQVVCEGGEATETYSLQK